MPIQLLVAIFDYSLLAEKALQDAIDRHPDFARALSTVSLFDRTAEHTVIARMIQLDRNGKLVDASRSVLSEELLKSLVPVRADWSVVSSAFGDEFPQTALNGEFCAFLEIMMLQRTCSVFFVPNDEDAATHFIESMRPTASVLLHTTMTPDELQTLRVSLIASRQNEMATPL